MTHAVIAGAALVVLLAYLAAGALGIGSSARDYLSTPDDSPWVHTVLPAIETPFDVPWSASVAVTRASWEIARGRRTAPRDVAAVASALAVTALGLLLIDTGLAPYPVLIAMLAMAVGATFWSRGIAWTPDVFAPVLMLISAHAGWRWLREPHRRPLVITAAITGTLGLIEDPAWVACLPAVAIWFWSRVPEQRQRFTVVVVLGGMAAAALWPLAVRATVAGSLARVAQAGVEPPGMFALWKSLVPTGASVQGTTARIFQEFSPLGGFLVIVGIAAACRDRRHRLAIAAAIVGLLGWFWWAPRSAFDPVSVPLSICGWAMVAVALNSLAQSLHPRAGQALVAIVGMMLIAEPALTRLRLNALGQDRASEDQARMAYDFDVTELPPDVAIVSEGRRVDQTILLSSHREARPVMFVPQTAAQLQPAVHDGRQAIAFANARAHLERLGFIFERGWIGTTDVNWLAGQVPCVALTEGAWPDVSSLLAVGSVIAYGATPTSAPGGLIMRLTDPQPIRVSRIEPRSLPFEIGPVPHDAAPGIGELDRAAAPGAVPQVITLRVPYSGRPEPVTLTFASPPQAAVATAQGSAPVTLCARTTGTMVTLGRSEAATATLQMNALAFGAGWHSAEADPAPFRWTGAPHASVRVTVAPAGAVRVTVTAFPAARQAQQPTMGLAVNGCQQPVRRMGFDLADYEWDVPASCWRTGSNQLWIETGPLVTPASLGAGPDMRLLGARVGAIRLARLPRDQNAK